MFLSKINSGIYIPVSTNFYGGNIPDDTAIIDADGSLEIKIFFKIDLIIKSIIFESYISYRKLCEGES